MRFVRLALLTGVLTAGHAAAQTGGGNLGAASQAAGSLSTAGNTSGTSTTTSTAGGGSSTTTTGTGTADAPLISGATVTGFGPPTAATGGAVSPSNFLGGTYSNPYYQGLFTNTTGAPGQFGAPLYGAASGTTTASTATRSGTGATTRTTTTGSTGGANPFGTSASPFGQAGRTTGGQLGGGQFGGTGVNSQFGGQVVPLPRNIAYSAVLRFPAPQVAPAQRLADVQAVVARSSMLSSPAGVSVAQDGSVLVLRGSVANEDEFRLAENMIRMTPGVREVRNELTYPVR